MPHLRDLALEASVRPGVRHPCRRTAGRRRLETRRRVDRLSRVAPYVRLTKENRFVLVMSGWADEASALAMADRLRRPRADPPRRRRNQPRGEPRACLGSRGRGPDHTGTWVRIGILHQRILEAARFTDDTDLSHQRQPTHHHRTGRPPGRTGTKTPPRQTIQRPTPPTTRWPNPDPTSARIPHRLPQLLHAGSAGCPMQASRMPAVAVAEGANVRRQGR